MTLEKEIGRLADAVELLAKVFVGTAQQVAGTTVTNVDTAATTKPVPAAKAAPAPKAPKAAKPEAPAVADKDLADLANTPAVDFEEVRAITRRLGAERTRDDVVALLAEFKVAKAGELKPEQYAAYIDRATAILNGSGAAEEEDLSA